MNQSGLKAIIKNEVVKLLMEQSGRRLVPAAASGRHLHLSRADADVLFGNGYEFERMRPLSQPGQFVCKETVEIQGPKGSIKNVRVLGPERKETQIEVSVTDTFRLGVPPVVKMSGDTAGSPGCRVIGPRGSVEIGKGLMISARHLHISAEQAAQYGVKDGDIVKLRCGGERATVFENVAVRAGVGHELEVHLDTDEANAALLENGDYLEIIE